MYSVSLALNPTELYTKGAIFDLLIIKIIKT